jgi:hypothetical protein
LFFRWIKQHLRIKPSTAPRKTPSRRRSGQPSLFTCW